MFSTIAHPATGFNMWTPPTQPDAVFHLLKQSLTKPDYDWKGQALYYAEKSQQLGMELGNVRHHLAASCMTIQSLLGKTRNIDPLIVSVTLESHWQGKYIQGKGQLDLLASHVQSLEESLAVVRQENEILTLQLADHVRENQKIEDQMLAVSDLWAVSPPESPRHLMPMQDAPQTGIIPDPSTIFEIKLPVNDKALKLDKVMHNMGYSSRGRDVAHVMACYQRSYIKQYGVAPLPKYYYASDNAGDKNKSKRLTLLSESDLPMLSRVIRDHGVKRK